MTRLAVAKMANHSAGLTRKVHRSLLRHAARDVCALSMAAVLLAGAGCGSDSSAPRDTGNQSSFQLSSLEEHCGDQTGAGIVSSIQPEYAVTLRPGSGFNLPPEMPLTIRLVYQGGELTCYPAIVPPPGSKRAIILERVGVVIDMQFFTTGTAFNEHFETEIKGRSGNVTFSHSVTPDMIGGTYRPDLPGYEDVGVGFWGNFGGDQTNGGIVQFGTPPGRGSELTFVAQWAT